MRYPAVVRSFTEKDGATAELTVLAELHNVSDKPVQGKFQAEIAGLALRVEQRESLAAGEKKSVKLVPQDFSQLAVRNPKILWPGEMGSAELEEPHNPIS